MKHPPPSSKNAVLSRLNMAQTYRSVAFVFAVVGSFLMYLGGVAEQSLWAFVGVLVMFVGAAVAIVAVVMAIRDKNAHEIILGLVLLMWLVLLPLIILARQLHASPTAGFAATAWSNTDVAV